MPARGDGREARRASVGLLRGYSLRPGPRGKLFQACDDLLNDGPRLRFRHAGPNSFSLDWIVTRATLLQRGDTLALYRKAGYGAGIMSDPLWRGSRCCPGYLSCAVVTYMKQ